LCSVIQVDQPLGAMLVELATRDVHPPLYPLLLWGWTSVAGFSEAAVRLPSAAFGTLAIVPLYAIGVKLFDRPTALLASLFLSLNAYAVFYAQEARSYSLLLLLGLAATWFLLEWAEHPQRLRRKVAYIATATALGYTHVFGLFLLLAHGIYAVVWLPGLRRQFLQASVVIILLLAPWLPFLAGQVNRVQGGFWIAPIALRDPIDWAARWAGFSRTLAVVLMALALVGLWTSSRTRGGQFAVRPLFLTFLAVPILLPVAISMIGQPIFHPKYPIFVVGALSLLAAKGLTSLPSHIVVPGALPLMVLLVVQLTVEVYPARKQQWRELAALARKEAAAGAILAADGHNRVALPFYLREAAVEWLDRPEDVDRLEAFARSAGSKVLFLQIHPARSPREDWLDQRLPRTKEHLFIGARAVQYDAVSTPLGAPE
jgi:mannosyltransferase